MLEEEVYNSSSPIWDPEFTPVQGADPQATDTPGGEGSFMV